MRRLLWILAGLLVVGAGVYLLGAAPRAYFLRKQGELYHEERRERYLLLAFRIARADPDVRADLQKQRDEMLRETKTEEVRGWEIVYVPAGARAPGPPYTMALRLEPFGPADPPQLKGPMEIWIRPRGWLARLFARA
jgi:hypothetical protein